MPAAADAKNAKDAKVRKGSLIEMEHEVIRFHKTLCWCAVIIVGTTIFALAIFYDCSRVENLITSLFVGVFVWFMTAYLPEKKRDARIRRFALQKYSDLRISLVQHIAMATNRQWLPTVEAKRLSEYATFRKEVKSKCHDQSLADSLANRMDDDLSIRSDIEALLDAFVETLEFAMGQLPAMNDRTLQRYCDFREHVKNLRCQSAYLSDRSKYLAQFVLEILSCWSSANGYEDLDWIEYMLRGDES